MRVCGRCSASERLVRAQATSPRRHRYRLTLLSGHVEHQVITASCARVKPCEALGIHVAAASELIVNGLPRPFQNGCGAGASGGSQNRGPTRQSDLSRSAVPSQSRRAFSEFSPESPGPLTLELTSRFTLWAVTSTISVLAGKFGITSDTLRYYERVGLLAPTERTQAGYRLYDENADERLQFIKGAQKMGLRLADIKELLDVRDRGQCPCGHTKVLVERRLAEVTAEIRDLSTVKRQLVDLKQRNDACLKGTADDWSCTTQFAKGGDRNP